MDTADKTVENETPSKTWTKWWQFILFRILVVVIPNICGLFLVLPALFGTFPSSSNETTLLFEYIILRFGAVIFLLGFILGAPLYALSIINNKKTLTAARATGSVAVKFIPINIQGFKTVIKDTRGSGVAGFMLIVAIWAFVAFFGFIFVVIDIIKRLQGKYYEQPKEPGLTEEELNDPEAKKFRKKADIMLIVCIVFCIMIIAHSSLIKTLMDVELLMGFAMAIFFFMYCLKWLPKAIKYKKAFVVTFTLILCFVTGVVCLV